MDSLLFRGTTAHVGQQQAEHDSATGGHPRVNKVQVSVLCLFDTNHWQNVIDTVNLSLRLSFCLAHRT